MVVVFQRMCALQKSPHLSDAGVERLRRIAVFKHPHRPGFPAGFSTFPTIDGGGLLGLQRAGPSAPLDEVVNVLIC